VIEWYRRITAIAARGRMTQTEREGITDNQQLLDELTAEHRRIDERIKHLERQRSMTAAEQAEYHRLKKQKLFTKDRIARLA
jgi:uncharacterized protein YdcH (DUF465 family)